MDLSFKMAERIDQDDSHEQLGHTNSRSKDQQVYPHLENTRFPEMILPTSKLDRERISIESKRKSSKQ
jgi:hypothetical protein